MRAFKFLISVGLLFAAVLPIFLDHHDKPELDHRYSS